MKPHKLCKLFPAITGQPLLDLIQDIKTNGLRQPITTYEGQILDGANRYAACLAAGVSPQFIEYDGDNPMAFVISQNMNRRHLTESQRAAIAAEIATTKHGGNRDPEQEANSSLATNEDAANIMKVSTTSVKQARKLKSKSPTLHKRVKEGKISLHAATESLKPTHPPQPDAIKGIDMAKLDQPEPPAPAEPPPAPSAPEPKPTTMTLPAFRKEIERLKAQADAACNGDQKQRDIYGTIANDLARHLLNPVQAEYNPYGR